MANSLALQYLYYEHILIFTFIFQRQHYFTIFPYLITFKNAPEKIFWVRVTYEHIGKMCYLCYYILYFAVN